MATKKTAKVKASAKKPAGKSGAKTAAKSAAKAAKRAGSKSSAVAAPGAVRLLAKLPPVDTKARMAYQNSFSVEECEQWGASTKAQQVLNEADRAVAAAFTAIKRTAIAGYSPRRLAWLCEKIVELHDSVIGQGELGSARNAMVALGDQTRRQLAAMLLSVAGTNSSLRQAVNERNETSTAPHAIQSALTGLIQLGTSWLRAPAYEPLCEDAGLNDAVLQRAYAVVESLQTTNDATYAEQTGVDTAETNRIEGRVLRELKFMQMCFDNAREAGAGAPKLPPVASLNAVGDEAQTEHATAA